MTESKLEQRVRDLERGLEEIRRQLKELKTSQAQQGGGNRLGKPAPSSLG